VEIEDKEKKKESVKKTHVIRVKTEDKERKKSKKTLEKESREKKKRM
jgi:hypothetical protein